MEYRDRPVFDTRPTFTDSVAHGLLDDFSYDAPTGGAAIPWKPTSGPKRTLGLPFLIESYDQFRPWRAFFAGREGRRRGFWVPTWLTDFIVTQDVAAGSLTIRIKHVGLTDKVSFGAQFKHLALITWSKMELYRIDDIEVDGAEEVITLDHVLESNLVAGITVCCGLMYVRLADDEIEYEYISGGAAKVNLRFVELPKETEGTAHEGTKPMFLYIIQQGSAVFRYTNYPITRNIGGLDYEAQPLEHGEVSEDVELNSDPFDLTCATDDPAHPFRQLLDTSFVVLTTLLIYETDADAPVLPASPIFKGRIQGCDFGNRGAVTGKVSTLLRIGEIDAPQALSERTCIHETYDGHCGLNPLAFTTSGPITAKSSNPPWIEAVEFGAKATLEGDPNWFALGLVTVGTEQRFCTKQVGNRLYINVPFKFAIVGNTASALAGDDKRVDTCHDKFANIDNHLGFAFMPNKNPQFEALVTPKPGGGKK